MKRYLPFLIIAALIAGPLVSFAADLDSQKIAELQAQIRSLQEKLRMFGVSGLASSATHAGQSTGASAGGSGFVVPVKPISSDLTIFDDDTSDDDIVQLNNLRIQSVDAGSGVISASNEFGISCVRYQGMESAEGFAFPCPVPPSILYKIKVDSDTRLLLRNRMRATLADFSAGDRINVYGFMDRDTNAIDALIVRNIDKPAVRKFIQLNNTEVSTAPGSSVPTSFIVIQNGISPCLDYGERGTGGSLFPCPAGLETRDLQMKIGASAQPGSAGASGGLSATGMEINPMYYYPMPRKYSVNVTAETQLMGRNRQPISLKDIEVGDALNIYGYQSANDSSVINALVIRDLSKPVTVENAVLRVAVTAGNIRCAYPMNIGAEPSTTITSPCGVLYNATVEIYNASGAFVAKGTTATGVAVFENLRPGTYTVAASAPGYARNKISDIILNAHQIQTVTISLGQEESGTISIKSLDSLNGVVGAEYRSTFEAAGANAYTSYSWEVTNGSLPPGLSLVQPPMPMMPCYEGGACPEFIQNRIWLTGKPTVAGTYKFTLRATNTSGQSGSATFVATISGGSERLSYWVRTDKSAYTPDEKIQITIGIKNNSAEPRTLNFSSGCQTSYIIHPVFNSQNGMMCTLALTAVTIPAGESHVWNMTHSPDQLRLTPGQYKLEGSVIGHGSAFTSLVVQGSAGSNQPPTISGVQGPTMLTAGQLGYWTVKARDPEGGSLNYAVTWGDEVSGPTVSSPSMGIMPEKYVQTSMFSHAYANNGVYTPTFVVFDGAGLSAKTSMTVRVGEMPVYIPSY